MKNSVVVLLLALSASGAIAQESLVRLESPAGKDVPWTGNLRVDLLGAAALGSGPAAGGRADSVGHAGGKSPWIAAGMSLVVPGAGQVYNGDYWKAALFFAAEVGAWVIAYHYDKKGNQQTDFFQGFADQHWSVVQYANYTEGNLKPPNPPYNWRIPGTAGRPPWEQVNWAELNRMERDIAGFYSHTLPPYGDQQYYELIGKYPQFNQGWDDANLSLPPDYDIIKANLTPRYLYYGGERGKANNYYASATTYVTIALVNHVVSAIEAAWSAPRNSGVHAEADLQVVPTESGMTPVPVLRVQYSF
jgi:hypothetical protein